MIRAWGSDLKGRVVHLISLVSDDLRANISTYGAVLQDLRCNDLPHSLVLGFPNLQPYLTNPPYLGAIVGRYANRIAKARIDGATIISVWMPIKMGCIACTADQMALRADYGPSSTRGPIL